jgi:hypothetical protein
MEGDEEAMTETTAKEVAAAALAKPREGSPCNRCGLCCLWEQCSISVEMFGPQRRCPVLERVGDGYACGLITKGPPLVAMVVGLALGIGTECDSGAPWED